MVQTEYQTSKCHMISFVRYGCFYTGTEKWEKIRSDLGRMCSFQSSLKKSKEGMLFSPPL